MLKVSPVRAFENLYDGLSSSLLNICLNQRLSKLTQVQRRQITWGIDKFIVCSLLDVFQEKGCDPATKDSIENALTMGENDLPLSQIFDSCGLRRTLFKNDRGKMTIGYFVGARSKRAPSNLLEGGYAVVSSILGEEYITNSLYWSHRSGKAAYIVRHVGGEGKILNLSAMIATSDDRPLRLAIPKQEDTDTIYRFLALTRLWADNLDHVLGIRDPHQVVVGGLDDVYCVAPALLELICAS